MPGGRATNPLSGQYDEAAKGFEESVFSLHWAAICHLSNDDPESYRDVCNEILTAREERAGAQGPPSTRFGNASLARCNLGLSATRYFEARPGW